MSEPSHSPIDNLITEHIDIWSSAIKRKSSSGRGSSKKIELYGIKKLRKLILELAVRGKLVPQDLNDEPASVLLERIAAEKEKLLSSGQLKPVKKAVAHDATISANDLPLNWKAVDFGDITFNLDARRIPLSVNERKSKKGNYDYYGASGVIDTVDDYLFDKPLLLIGEDGANLVSRSTPIAFIARGKYWVNNHAHVVDGISESFLQYLCLYINSISLLPYITGMAQPKMNQAKMNSILVLLPPESEQNRIVAKVDELMALCDRLEAQTESSLDVHQTLVKVLLDTLVNSQNAEELAENWTRISGHFDTLFTTEHSIDQLKKTILQLAVMGKLVEQNANDEPASVLLERISAEKADLIKQGKIKKQKPLPPINEDEKPFDLPEGWEWVCLSNIGVFAGGKTPSKANSSFWDGSIPWVTPKDMKVDLIYDSEDHVTQSAIDDGLAEIPKDSILLVARSGILRRKLPVAVTKTICTVNQDLKVLALFDISMSNYVALMLKGFESYILSNLTKIGTTVESLMFDEFSKHYFMLPPLEEQHRIVAKVDELMAICDQLKAQLSEAQTTQLNLADALVEQAL